jgi:ATP-dependent Clp protease ATP-binding subunit ClpC
MEKHSVSKLIGSPPGYVGYEEGGQLTERVKRNPYSIILLDEIEKAHPDVYNILLQVFEDGQLTDGLGNTVDFKNTIIIMTSNLGARFLDKKKGIGFDSPTSSGIAPKVEDQVMSEVKKNFNPEFLNRLDEVIMFNALTDEDMGDILKLMLKKETKMAAERGLGLSFSPEAQAWMLAQNNEPQYGARPLRRIIRRFVREPLADFLLRANPPHGTKIDISVANSGGALAFATVGADGSPVSI